MEKNQIEQKMQKVLDRLIKEFGSLQVWRATKWLVENIQVDAWYWIMWIWQLANITIPDNSTIRIEPRDKSITNKIEKSIYDANIWLSPQNNWDYLFIKIPALTTERRKEITKQVASMWEEWKKRVRQIRQDERDIVKKTFESKEISEDEKKNNEEQIDEMTKTFNEKIEKIVKAKEQDVMTV